MTATADLEELTIADLFALSNHSTKLAAGLDPEQFKAMQAEAKSLGEPVAWSEMRGEIAGVMTDALRTKVIGAWVSAWQTCKEVTEKAEKSHNSPNTPFSCTLVEHSIDSTLHPYVEVTIGQKLVQRIDFDVTLSTQIDVLILKLKGGSIVSIQPGRCECSGTIEAQGVQLAERKLAQLDLPGNLVLKHPIPISFPKRLAS